MNATLPEAKLGGPKLNVFGTLDRYPKLLKAWSPFGNHVLFENSLTPREREVVILRVGWLSRSGYEWGQHVVIEQRLDLVFTVGQYMLVSMALNTLGVEIDEGYGGLESGGAESVG